MLIALGVVIQFAENAFYNLQVLEEVFVSS